MRGRARSVKIRTRRYGRSFTTGRPQGCRQDLGQAGTRPGRGFRRQRLRVEEAALHDFPIWGGIPAIDKSADDIERDVVARRCMAVEKNAVQDRRRGPGDIRFL